MVRCSVRIRLIHSVVTILGSLLSKRIQLNLSLQCIELLFEVRDFNLEKLAVLACVEVKPVRDELVQRRDLVVLIVRWHQILLRHSLGFRQRVLRLVVHARCTANRFVCPLAPDRRLGRLAVERCRVNVGLVVAARDRV